MKANLSFLTLLAFAAPALVVVIVSIVVVVVVVEDLLDFQAKKKVYLLF